MIDNEKIGRAIRTLRERAGYTQKELADKLFISNVAVSKWERGKSVPDTATLQRLSALLDMDVDGLLDGTASYHDDRWRGVLLLEAGPLGADTPICDKPLIDYLLSLFLLAGIRNVRIVCLTADRDYIDRRFCGGDMLGIRLSFTEPGVAILSDGEISADTAVMLIPRPFFIYGVDLTRFLQRAMQQKSAVVQLGSVVGAGEWSKRDGYAHYGYRRVPLLFLRGEAFAALADHGDLGEALETPKLRETLSLEPMDKGFVVSDLRGEEDVRRAAELVRIIQELGGYLVDCPLEIAWRRGMIDREKMLREAQAFPEYEGYLEKL